MGSPFTHLHQHYFPARYPCLNDARWQGLRDIIKTEWINVFRVDDFVGTLIDPGKRGWPNLTQYCLLPGGHTDYFRQPEVLKEIRSALPGA